jgi:hypothetical protein
VTDEAASSRWADLTENERHILACLCEDITGLGQLALHHGGEHHTTADGWPAWTRFDPEGAMRTLDSLVLRGLAVIVEFDPQDRDSTRRELDLDEARSFLAEPGHWPDPRQMDEVQTGGATTLELWTEVEATDRGVDEYWPHREEYDPWPSAS